MLKEVTELSTAKMDLFILTISFLCIISYS